MKAMVITAFGGPEVFEARDLPKPTPGPKEVLVKVHATSINPVDYQTRRGDYRDLIQTPETLGVDVSGVVEAAGDAVTDFEVGDEVYYTPQLFGGPGSYAEYHAANEDIVARKPANLSHLEAASIPLAGGTVWDALVTRGNLRVGETILVHAGAGGVGSLAIQLAKSIGARVFATCSARNAEFVKGLGADYAIDYRSEDYVEVVQWETAGAGVDLVLDTVGGDTIQRSPQVMGPFGRLVTIVNIAAPQSLLDAWDKNATIHFLFTPQYRAKLDRLRDLLERREVKPVIDSVMPLSKVAEAHERVERGGMRGKVVLDATA